MSRGNKNVPTMALLVALTLTGCAQGIIGGPLGSAIYADVARTQLMVTAGGDIVPAGWATCLPKIAEAFGKLGAMVSVQGQPGLVSEALILDTLDGLAQRLPADCGQLLARIQLRTLQRGVPGL